MSLGLSSTSDVTTFDQNWHHLYSTFAGGKDLSNDAQIRVIGRMEPKICTKMLKKLSEKLRAKLRATSPGCSMVEVARLDDAFFRSFLTKSKPSHCSKKKRKGEKGKAKKQTFKNSKSPKM